MGLTALKSSGVLNAAVVATRVIPPVFTTCGTVGTASIICCWTLNFLYLVTQRFPTNSYLIICLVPSSTFEPIGKASGGGQSVGAAFGASGAGGVNTGGGGAGGNGGSGIVVIRYTI